MGMVSMDFTLKKRDPNALKLVIFMGKHGNSYYLFTTKEEWQKICLEEFNSRDKYKHNFGWYEDEAKKEIEKPDDIPDDSPDWVVEEHQKKVSLYESKLKEREDFRKEWELIQRARSGDEKAAAQIIYYHQGFEYESYDIVTPKTVETLETASK